MNAGNKRMNAWVYIWMKELMKEINEGMRDWNERMFEWKNEREMNNEINERKENNGRFKQSKNKWKKDCTKDVINE